MPRIIGRKPLNIVVSTEMDGSICLLTFLRFYNCQEIFKKKNILAVLKHESSSICISQSLDNNLTFKYPMRTFISKIENQSNFVRTSFLYVQENAVYLIPIDEIHSMVSEYEKGPQIYQIFKQLQPQPLNTNDSLIVDKLFDSKSIITQLSGSDHLNDLEDHIIDDFELSEWMKIAVRES